MALIPPFFGEGHPMINFLQILINGVVLGSIYLLATVGLTLTYGLAKFPNFAHAEFITWGGYIGYMAIMQLGLSTPIAFFVVSVGSAILGVLSYVLVFKPLSDHGATIIHLMVASIGLGFIIRHLAMEMWGSEVLSFKIVWTPIYVGTVSTTILWISAIMSALLMSIVMHLTLTKTKIGKAMRATSDNMGLAEISGIDINHVMLLVWLIGAALAGIGGIFLSMGSYLVPTLGLRLLLSIFAVAILGGIGDFYGVLAASYIIGFAESFGVIILIQLGLSVDYRSAISFIILVLMLIFKPGGIRGVLKRRD